MARARKPRVTVVRARKPGGGKSRPAAGRTGRRPATRPAAARRPSRPAARGSAKRSVATRSVAKRPAAKRSAAQRSVAAKRPAAKRAGPKRTAAKRAVTAKRAAPRTAAQRSVARKAATRRAAARTTARKRTAPLRSAAKRAAPKRAAARRTIPQRAAPKRAVAKPAAPARPAAPLTRGIHDVGGVPGNEPIDRSEHAMHSFEKRVSALLNLLMHPDKRIMRVDELRRGIESLNETEYAGYAYYERWVESIRRILLEKGLLDEAELARKVAEVSRRFSDGTGAPAGH